MSAAPPPSIYTESFSTSSNNTTESESINVEETRENILSGFSFEEYFQVSESISVIIKNNFKKIALQLPDYLLWASSELSNKIQNSVPLEYGIKVFILGDTSYGSCCVDEVTSSHLKSDFIIHYGHSCLSPSSKIPVQYVFGKKKNFNVDKFSIELNKLVESKKEENFVIFYDLLYHHNRDSIENLYKNNDNIIVTNINNFNNIYLNNSFKNNKLNETQNCNNNYNNNDCCGSDNNNNNNNDSGCCGGNNNNNNNSGCCQSQSQQQQQQNDCCQQKLNNEINNENDNNNEELISGRKIEFKNEKDIKKFNFIWIGEESLTLTNLLMNFNQQMVYRYYIDDNKLLQETLPRNKSLMRRYHISEKCKDASIIGIVVSTLSVQKYSETIDGLKKLIIASGKKPYVFVVGRLNVPKLANFSEIDIYVIVACHENTMVDSKDFYKPIATPFELNLSLRNEKWTGEYITDFGRVFPKLIKDLSFDEDDENKCEIPEDQVEDDQGNIHHFSLVTGRIVIQNKNQSTLQQQQQQQQQQTQQSGDLISVNNQFKQVSLVGEHLSNKTYKGLDMRIGETPVTTAIEGMSGIPKNYNTDKNNL